MLRHQFSNPANLPAAGGDRGAWKKGCGKFPGSAAGATKSTSGTAAGAGFQRRHREIMIPDDLQYLAWNIHLLPEFFGCGDGWDILRMVIGGLRNRERVEARQLQQRPPNPGPLPDDGDYDERES